MGKPIRIVQLTHKEGRLARAPQPIEIQSEVRPVEGSPGMLIPGQPAIFANAVKTACPRGPTFSPAIVVGNGSLAGHGSAAAVGVMMTSYRPKKTDRLRCNPLTASNALKYSVPWRASPLTAISSIAVVSLPLQSSCDCKSQASPTWLMTGHAWFNGSRAKGTVPSSTI